MAGGGSQCHQPRIRQRLDIGKQRRKVYATINRQSSHSAVPCLFHQQRERPLERQQGKCPTGVHLHDGGRGIGDNRLSVWRHLPFVQGRNNPQQPPQTMRGTTITLTVGDIFCHHGGMCLTESIPAQHPVCQRISLC
jgi:hypothetical protein